MGLLGNRRKRPLSEHPADLLEQIAPGRRGEAKSRLTARCEPGSVTPAAISTLGDLAGTSMSRLRRSAIRQWK